ncbi:MAG: hypothetical protein C0605_07135 [Hyphomicrobiales bacterium]|nr:MAG: hypothetical protein C0605_07135 [Hyphomicrobiales bacterium]
MKWKPVLKASGIGAAIGYILAALIAFITIRTLFDMYDNDTVEAMSVVIYGPPGAAFGALVGGIYAVVRGTWAMPQEGATGDLSDAPAKRAGLAKSGRNLPRTAAAIVAAIAGAAALLILCIWFFISFPTWMAYLFGGEDVPDVIIYLHLTLGTVLWFIMPPVSAGLGALAGAKLVLRYWPK